MSKPLAPQASMRPTRTVAVSNASGGGMNGMIVAFLMFGLARYYGGNELIPHDVLEIVPWLVVLIGTCTHFIAELFTRERHVAEEQTPKPPEPEA